MKIKKTIFYLLIILIYCSNGVALAQSALAKPAAEMAPGTWAKLNLTNQDSILGVGPTSGSTIHYCNSMPWNSLNKSIEIVAMDHAALKQRYMRYDESSNSFVLVMADDGEGTYTRHGYDHNAVNPFTGDLYHRIAEFGYENTGILVRKFPFGGTAFTDMARVPTLFYMQNAFGVCWWSGPFLGAGAQGCLLMYNSGDSQIAGAATDGGIYAYDPLTDKWFWTSLSMSPFYGMNGYSYHSVMEYSAIHNCAVYGGGGDSPRKLWRLNSDRSVTAMPDAPQSTYVGIQLGNLVCDPATGNFLLLSAGELWELNPTGSGTWTQQTGSRVPPSGVGIPGGPNVTFIYGMISSAISDHCVVAYIQQTGLGNGTFYLYKHATCTPTSTNKEIEENNINVKIYPNPAVSNVSIEFSIDKFADIEVTDILGKIIETKKRVLSPLNLNTENFKSGVYFVRIISEKLNSQQKFIKK